MNIELGMSILLVEDDEIDAENVKRSLPRKTRLQHSVTLNDAIEVISQQSLDLVLLDPGLPDCSGVDSFRRIRHAAPELPIVILTGLEDKQLAVQIIRMGAQDYLLKNQLDERAIQSLQFAVERGRLLEQIQIEQAARERMATELREQEQSLAHLGRVTLMGELVAEITHEISQPLNVISVLTGALDATHQQEPLEKSKCVGLIQKLAEANSHAREILHRLREFIRNESTEFVAFDVKELITSTTEFIDFESRRRKIEIRHDLHERDLMVLGNKTQIRQVLVNLLRNAFDAMTQTVASKRFVTVRSFREGHAVIVEVADQGSGLQIDLPSAFAAFRTTKSEGLGMGLAICGRIIHNHNGRIDAVPTDCSGATFRFELPSVKR